MNAPAGRLTLDDWLERIQRLHPQEIELGLDRVSEVARRAGIGRPAPLLITIAGTNGKGSCVAALDIMLRAAGWRSGSYTSPHLLRFNERVHVDGRMATDAALCEAFARVDSARGDTGLTYFEFATLAALLILQDAGLDAVILETGLGGRLDAVNILDADVAVISSIDLDHQQWLGDTRDAIGREKAGIMRAGRPVVCGDREPPPSIVRAARELGCPLYIQGREFDWHRDDAGHWSWQGLDGQGQLLALPELPMPGLSLINLSTSVQVLALCAPRTLRRDSLVEALPEITLAGRQQRLLDRRRDRSLLLDVAHNPQAAATLARVLEENRRDPDSRVHLVLAMLADKDCAGLYRALEKQVDIWYIAQFQQARGLAAGELHDRLCGLGATAQGPFPTVSEAYLDACARASRSDTIVIAGSFFTVSEILQFLDETNACDAPC